MTRQTQNLRTLCTLLGVVLALGAAVSYAQTTTASMAGITMGTASATSGGAAARVTSGTEGPILPPLEAEPNQEGLRFNFRGTSLNSLLDYMSKVGGFVIIRETVVEGTVDVVSHQPLNKEESVLLLDTLLHQKGLAAIRSGRTLTIVKREEARTRDLPIRVGSDPTSIPKTQEMVTQIMPVRHSDVNQLIQNLEPLLPDYATITANQSSNVIILIDTQTNIHRVAQIIQALDTSISGVSRIRVFTVRRADAAELATTINTLFGQSAAGGGSDQERRDRMREFFERMRGGGGPPGGDMFGGRGGGRGGR